MLTFSGLYLRRRLRIAALSLIFVAVASVFLAAPFLILFLIFKWLPLFFIGVAVFAFLVLLLIFGMIWGGYHLHPRYQTIVLPNLPEQFDGLKIIQLSDSHLGTFGSPAFVERAVSRVLAEKPDVIFFTGDLVNNRAKEALPFISALQRLSAPLGVFSILGNHDYGDYVSWKSTEDKKENLEELISMHGTLGWKLLLNEHEVITRGGESIALIGVQNWGHSMGFPKYGDLKVAVSGLNDTPVKLLLSHDPTHWRYKVLPEWKDIDVTFSGHTHGGQFGFEIGSWKWSPVKYVYPEWAGLYKKGSQYLYVNRGLGMLAYSGRVGIWPEISVITLKRK